MAFMYFDESIRERGGFIVGALVVSPFDISERIRSFWQELGINPQESEYKSASLKVQDPVARQQRAFLRGLLQDAQLALTVCPSSKRRQLGAYCCSLVEQLIRKGLVASKHNELLLDEGIRVASSAQRGLAKLGVNVCTGQNSLNIAGLQLADHAAHALGGMLLEEMGLFRKMVRADGNSGYDPETEFELGFELWAGLRYALIGKQQHLPEQSSPSLASPYYRVDGYGLFIANSCSSYLAEHSRRRFGTNYLGCMH